MFTRSFYTLRSQKHKITDDLTAIFVLLGSTRIKAACKMLMKVYKWKVFYEGERKSGKSIKKRSQIAEKERLEGEGQLFDKRGYVFDYNTGYVLSPFSPS